MVFKKFKEDIVEPYAKSKIVITFYCSIYSLAGANIPALKDQVQNKEGPMSYYSSVAPSGCLTKGDSKEPCVFPFKSAKW